MNTYQKTLTPMIALLSAAIVAGDATSASLDVTRQVRVITGSTNSRDDNNGGGDPSNLIGINPGGVDNFQIIDFDFSELAGKTVLGDAILTFDSSTNQTGSTGGSAADTVWVRALFDDNAGWVQGGQSIGSSDNNTNNGSASFENRVQYNDDGSGPSPNGISTPWLDDSGIAVADLLAALGPNLDTAAGVVDSNRPGSPITFTIAQATVQGWIDNGFAGIVVGNDDDGNGSSRFRMDNGNLSFEAIPEPASLTVGLLGIAGLCLRRRRG